MFWTIALYSVLAVHIVCSLLLILVVLMQRPRSEGLGAAFGGGFTDSVFGAQTTDVLTKFTIYLASIFFAATLALAYIYAHRTGSNLSKELLQAKEPALPATAAQTATPTAPATPAPAAPAAPAPAAPAPAK
jgi:preprotein translocase subunit SecG